MNVTRRLMMKASVAAASLTVMGGSLRGAPTHNALPDPSKLQNGDLLWPKYQGSRTLASGEKDTEEKQLSEAIEKIGRAIPQNASPAELEAFNSLTLDQFRDRYYGGQGLHQSLAGTFGVGHVAIISVEQDSLYVIEAVLHANQHEVRRISYDKWLSEYKRRQPSGHPFEVWHARPSVWLGAKGDDTAQEARKYVSRPYNLANTSLDDTNSFYCSKLAYVCLRAAARNSDGMKRLNDAIPVPTKWYFPWISPRSLLEHGQACGAFALINSPSVTMNE